jgi:hypothetical protein
MLIEKEYKLNDVLTLKMVSGEEIIGRFGEETITQLVLIKPFLLMPSPNGQLGMAPALFSADPAENVRVNKSAIAMQTRTVKDLADQYISSTTGLTLARTL